MNAVIPHLHDFEGQPLASFTWNGRPCWIARHIGARVGYAQEGKRLPSLILRNWSEEFIAGHDYALLQGEDLATFQTAAIQAGAAPQRVGQGSLLVLFESGLHMVLAKTDQPVGRRLRRFLVDEVLPQIARTGAFQPDADEDDVDIGDEDPAPPVQLLLFLVPPSASRPSLAWRREDRMLHQVQVRDRWVDLCDRRLKVAVLHRAIDALRGDGLLCAADAGALELEAVRLATGLDFAALVNPPPAAPAAVAA